MKFFVTYAFAGEATVEADSEEDAKEKVKLALRDGRLTPHMTAHARPFDDVADLS